MTLFIAHRKIIRSFFLTNLSRLFNLNKTVWITRSRTLTVEPSLSDAYPLKWFGSLLRATLFCLDVRGLDSSGLDWTGRDEFLRAEIPVVFFGSIRSPFAPSFPLACAHRALSQSMAVMCARCCTPVSTVKWRHVKRILGRPRVWLNVSDAS